MKQDHSYRFWRIVQDGLVFGGRLQSCHSWNTESWNGTSWTELSDLAQLEKDLRAQEGFIYCY
jgi:hypothetical protein